VATIETDNPLTVVVDIRVDPGPEQSVVRREFVGLPQWDVRAVAAASNYGVKRGNRADEEEFDTADRNMANALRAAGFHGATVTHSIAPSPKHEGSGVILTVTVVAGSKIIPDFDGNVVVDKSTLLEILDIPGEADRSPARLSGKIEDAYHRRGYLDTRVQAELLGTLADARRTLRFTIREGSLVSITARVYPCLRGALDAKRLDEEIDSFLDEEIESGSSVDPKIADDVLVNGEIAKGARPFVKSLEPKAVYVPEVYERAVEHLRELYRSEGYIFAEISDATVVRGKCATKSQPGKCVEIPPSKIDETKLCQSDLDGLPKPSGIIPKSAMCVADPTKGVECSPTATVYIPVNPGPRSFLWDIVFDGAKAIPPKTLMSGDVAGSELHLGDPLSLKDIETARRKVLDYYRDEGYYFASVRATIEYSPDKSRARVRIIVNEGEQVVIDKIFVEGNRDTRESLIRARLLLEEGGVYRLKLARLSHERLGQLGVFSSISIGLVNPTIPGKHKSVQVQVNERAGQTLDIKVGASTGEGARAQLEYTYANIFGYAIAWRGFAKMSYQPFLLPPQFYDPVVKERWDRLTGLSRFPRRLDVSLAFPHTPILGAPVRTTLQAVDILDLRRDFRLHRFSPILSFTYQPVKWITALLAADYEINDFELFEKTALNAYVIKNPALAGLLKVPDGETGVVAVRASVIFDWRDNPLGATKNGYMQLSPEYVRTLIGSGSRQDFLHLTGGAGVYFKIPWLPKKPVLALELKGGTNINVLSCANDPSHVETSYVIDSVGSGPIDPITGLPSPLPPTPRLSRQTVFECDTYPDRLFYLGGSDSFRGMYPGEMLPQDSIDQITAALDNPDPTQVLDPAIRAQAPRGGNVYVNPRVELRVPAFKWGGFALFLDAANSWRDKSKFKPWILRYAVGVGLSVETPIGPLGLDFGVNLAPYTQFDERPWAINFSVGRF